MGWWITLGVLILLAILPLGGRVHYDSQGIRAWILAGPIRVGVYPLRKKPGKRPKKEKAPPDKEEQKEAPLPQPPQPPKPEKKEKGGSLTDFLPFVRLGLDFLGSLRRKLRITNLYLRLILASSDPADLGIQYGKAWEALGSIMPQAERAVKIKKRDIQVGCDFEADKTVVVFRMDLTITLGRLLALAVSYGIRALREFLKFRKKRESGGNNEPEITQHVGIDHSENP